LLNSKYFLWVVIVFFFFLSNIVSREGGATTILVLLPIIHIVLFHLYVIYFSSKKIPESRENKVGSSNLGLTFAFAVSFGHTCIILSIGEGAGYFILGSLIVVIVVSIPMYLLGSFLYSGVVTNKVSADDDSSIETD